MGKTRAIKLTEARSTFSALVNDVYRTQDRVNRRKVRASRSRQSSLSPTSNGSTSWTST